MPTSDEIKKLNEELDNLNNTIDDISKQIQNDLNKQLAVTSESVRNIVDGFEKGENQTKNITSAIKKAQVENRKLGLDQNRFQSQLLDIENQLAKKYSAKLKKQKESISSQIQDNLLQQQLNESLLDYLNTASTIAENEDKINKEKIKQNSLSNAINTSLEKTLGTQISSVKEMFTLTGLFVFLINAALKADEQTTNLAKSLTLTKNEAFLVREQLVTFSNDINDASITTSKLVESFSKLSKLVGFNIPLSKNLLKEFTTLTKNIGISEESAAGLGKITLATGKNARQVTTEALGTAQALQSQNGIQLDNREVLEDIGKVSGQLLANFKANPSAIAEAVTQARLLGTNLETVKKQSEALLNFESSIENELKAELLTGQQLNLERARAAALSGDQVNVMKELNNQNIDFNKFSQLNVIAQKSLAESLGLSADELSDQLFKQQMIGKSRAEIVAIGGEEAAQRLEQLTAQDKFNNAVLKLQDILGNLIAGPFGQLLSVLGDALNIVSLIGKPFAAISNLINSMLGPANVFGTILKGILFTAAGIAVFMNPIKGLLSLAVLGGVIAGLETLTKKPSSMDDGIIGPGGETVVSGPKGSIQLNKNDSIIAGTNLFDKGTTNGQTISPTIDLTPMIAAINQVKASVDRLYSKDTTINIDGKQVGTTLTQGSYRLA